MFGMITIFIAAKAHWFPWVIGLVLSFVVFFLPAFVTIWFYGFCVVGHCFIFIRLCFFFLSSSSFSLRILVFIIVLY